MAAGVVIDLTGNPWLITWSVSAGAALPATIVGVQATGNQAPPISIKRTIAQFGDSAVATNKIILKDLPGVGGAGTPREVARFIATGADFDPPQEWKPASKEAPFVGLQVTAFDDASAVLSIWQ